MPNPTDLEIIGDVQRNQMITFNPYNDVAPSNNYTATHPNAISDGDDKGKGDPSGSGTAGALVDVQTRVNNVTSNKYNENNVYQVII